MLNIKNCIHEYKCNATILKTNLKDHLNSSLNDELEKRKLYLFTKCKQKKNNINL